MRIRSGRKFSRRQLLHFTANLRASSYQVIFAPQLNVTGSTGAYDRIGGLNVRGVPGLRHRGIAWQCYSCRGGVFVKPVIKISACPGKVRVIEDIEKFAAEFHLPTLPQRKGFNHRKIKIDEVRSTNNVGAPWCRIGQARVA